MLFCFATGGWFIFYLLTYFWTNNHDTLILFSQLSYATSIVSLYSFLFFLYFFPRKKKKIFHPSFIGFIFVTICIYLFYTHTPYIVEGLYYHEIKKDWYELEGRLFPLHLFLSFLFIPLSIIIWIKSYRMSYFIEKKRIQYIIAWMLIFTTLSFFFLLFLPIFWFWAMEKYIAFFFIPFIIWVFYVIRRYDFLNLKITMIQFFLFLYSIISSYFILKIAHNFSEILLSGRFREYWGINLQSDWFIDFLVGVLLFICISYVLKYRFSAENQKDSFSGNLERMKNQIPFITNIDALNIYLRKEFKKHLKIDYVFIDLKAGDYDEIVYSYFQWYPSRNIFMNDIVFIEENKYKLWKKHSNINLGEAYLIFPFWSENNSIKWFFEVWKKTFNDPYFTNEVNNLRKFSYFLQWHIKYLSVYKKIQDLSINLDKKVDEKTIEYNTLLSKQKEFIRYVGHEIKNPITNAIFLCDSLKDESQKIDEGKNKDRVLEDSSILYQELIKVSELIKHIFSAEQFDLHKIKLYKKEVNIRSLLASELRGIEASNLLTSFDISLEDVWDIGVDEIQLRQVINNLLTNAIKFADKKEPKVKVTLQKLQWKTLILCIEDNGRGFNMIDTNNIFNKYSTWNGSSVGLWMWLYLCKKIIELHDWMILAWNSKNLWWASFTIII